MTLHSVNNPITKKTFMTALETLESTEENHADNVYPLIGDMCKEAGAMRALLKDRELINKEYDFDHHDIQDIKWQIELLEAMAEMRSWLPPSVK